MGLSAHLLSCYAATATQNVQRLRNSSLWTCSHILDLSRSEDTILAFGCFLGNYVALIMYVIRCISPCDSVKPRRLYPYNFPGQTNHLLFVYIMATCVLKDKRDQIMRLQQYMAIFVYLLMNRNILSMQ